MNRISLQITTAIGLLVLVLWAVLNRPVIVPPWPDKVAGFSFSPHRIGQAPGGPDSPDVAQIDEDLALLAGEAHAVRTYSVHGNLAEVPRLAVAHGLNVTLGAWVNDDPTHNETELARLIEVYKGSHRNVVRVIVGNETLLREEQSIDGMIRYLDRVRMNVWAPVSTAEPWHIWLEHPELAEHVDFIAAHLLPYWEGIGVESAVGHVIDRYQALQRAFPDKEIVIAEVGWPSNGRSRQDAVATRANQATFLRNFLAAAETHDLTYYLLEAFDQPWKQRIEGDAGGHWGIFDAAREPKFALTAPVVPIPGWIGIAGASIALSFLVLALLFRDSQGLASRGRGFLAVIAYAVATFVVWLLYEFMQRYLTPATLAVAVVLCLSALGVIAVLLAEAHEWAEALWMRRWRRMPELQQQASNQRLPKVSIHVPAYNEPPAMLKQTLDALAALDYPDFEVLVIDNNTKDPSVWRPVEAHCGQLGERFRFFHVDPLAGFKAGALNFALRNTDPAAEVVAVIDSDYQVDPGWLRELVPLFEQRDTAIVQAPQDYRDGDESLFKSMCQAEYRGFFHIGMVTRNERNAIIQHGTMTMVRRDVLDEVEGWGEWCITEDAELGLRIFELGYKAVYVPQSYGKGLMPDTFIDFKKQRFRWAYGAVLILRKHLSKLLGLKHSELTSGQRYHFVAGWLPWFADGFNLLFNIAALAWTTAMVWFPHSVAPPHVIFAVLPLSLFAFKGLKMLLLYLFRIKAGLRQTLGAGLAGLALSHVIARAMLTGLVNSRIGFFRTPKCASKQGLRRALADAREELLLLLAMLIGAGVVLVQQDADMLDVRVWSLLLLVQAIPYAAAVTLSAISATRRQAVDIPQLEAEMAWPPEPAMETRAPVSPLSP